MGATRKTGAPPGEQGVTGRRVAWTAWTETLALVVAVPVLGGWLRPADPFFLSGAFSWSCVPVLLIGLRHGGACGVACSLGLVLEAMAAWRLGLLAGKEVPLEPCIGLLVVGCVVGEFRDSWTRHLTQAERRSGELRARLERFSRVYHLLRASHERLERRLAGGAPSLRELLSILRKRLLPLPAGEPPLRALGEVLLGMMASYCGVQGAVLYEAGGDGRLEAAPAATLGGGGTWSEEPLVREALRRKCLVSVRSFAEERTGSALLAAIPLVDVYRRVWGVVAVSEMQFVAFNDDTLRLLAVLAAHVGDELSQAAVSRQSVSAMATLEQGLRAAQRDGCPAGLVALRLEEEQELAQVEALLSRHRILDGMWRVRRPDGTSMLLFLLPLTDPAGVESFIERLERTLASSGQQLPAPFRLFVRSWSYRPGEPAEELISQLRRACEMDDTEDRDRARDLPGSAELGASVAG